MFRSRINVLTLGFALVLGWQLAFADDHADPYLEQARAILKKAPLVDGHNDLPMVIRDEFGGDVEGHDISVPAPHDTDIPRLRAGGVGTQFWSVYVPSSLPPLQAIRQQLEQIDIALRLVRLYPDELMLATSVADIEQARKERKIASLIGIEGGHTIVNSLGVLRAYYDLGARYMTLTHYHTNDWADSATDNARHGGLTGFGKEVVHEMNRLGMMVDLSHVSVDTMNDVLDVTEAPVIFSHSSALALTRHKRNVPDDVLKRVTGNDGIVMVTFIPDFVSEERRQWAEELDPLTKDLTTEAEWRAVAGEYKKTNGQPPLGTLAQVADHIEYVARVAGYDHVGIGGDFYGQSGDDLVQGLEDVSRYPYLVAELLRRGWSEENIAKLSRDNLLRVFGQVEKVALRLQAERPPSLIKFTLALDPDPTT
ncbi:MAG: dipeptidase [Lysobacterales bacterium]